MHDCLFCGDPPAAAWLVIAGPGVAVCDRCVSSLADIVDASEPGPPSNSTLFGPCRFCGLDGTEARLIVGPEADATRGSPVICHACAGLCASIVREKLDLDGPWYRPLRFDGGDGIGPDGPAAEDPEPLLDAARARIGEVDDAYRQRMDELARLELPTDGEVPAIVRRKAIADLLGRIAVERQRRIPWSTARAVAEALF